MDIISITIGAVIGLILGIGALIVFQQQKNKNDF